MLNELDNTCSYDAIMDIANFIKLKTNIVPRIGIICGSGLGSMGEAVQNATILEYKDIPNFPVSTVQGHKGRLIFGHISNVPVICMQGRFHYYEGYPLSTCVMPVRLMKILGVTHLIASNAAGSLNETFKIGDIMLIRDHINLLGFAGTHPQRGPNDHHFGDRFFSMTKAYDPTILKAVKEIGQNLAISIKEGVYVCLGGPNFETVAELRALKIMGSDAVGMSTVHEIITGRHCGLICFAFSLITNVCVTDYESKEEANADEVLEVGKLKESELKKFVEEIVNCIGGSL